MILTLEGNSTLYKHPKAKTLYFAIPARMADDSQFSFKAGDKVSLEFIPESGVLVVKKK